MQEAPATAAAPSSSTATTLPHTLQTTSSTTAAVAAPFSWNPLPVESFARQVSQQLAESLEVPSVDLEIKPLDLNSKRRSSEELPSTRGTERMDEDLVMRAASHPLVRFVFRLHMSLPAPLIDMLLCSEVYVPKRLKNLQAEAQMLLLHACTVVTHPPGCQSAVCGLTPAGHVYAG